MTDVVVSQDWAAWGPITFEGGREGLAERGAPSVWVLGLLDSCIDTNTCDSTATVKHKRIRLTSTAAQQPIDFLHSGPRIHCLRREKIDPATTALCDKLPSLITY